MEVVGSALKRGITEEDIFHAIRWAIRAHELDGYTMFIGPGRSGQLLEVGLNRRDQVFHAMPARPKFL